MNELIFLFHALLIGASTLLMRILGPEALVAFISVQCILANIFVLKQISLFGFIATASDAFTVGATLGLELLQEHFGQQMAKKAITISGILLIFFCLTTQIHLIYTPAFCDITQTHFAALFTPTPRIIGASVVVYLFVQFFASWLYTTIQKSCPSFSVNTRTYLVLILSQFIDTILFSFLGLYGLVDNIIHVIVISFLIKLVTIIITALVITFLRPSSF